MNMTESRLKSLFGILKKLQEKLSSTASSSCPFVVPELNQLNDMVYEVRCPPPQEKPELEIVFFHGLQMKYWQEAHYTTWMCRDNSELWLTWLVELFPRARILIIAYDSSVKKTDKLGRLGMYCTGENLVHSLTADGVRVGKAKCPVVLVGHCLGGLVLKELCLFAGGMLDRKSAETFGVNRAQDFFSNLRGMFFYGTPHTGSFLCDKLQGCFSGELLKEIRTHEASNARRNEYFNDLKSKHGWHTSGVGESYKTYVELLGERIHLVPEASSRQNMYPYYTAPADHYDVCKPEGKTSTSFLQLGDFLRKIQRDAVVRTREAIDARCSREYVVDMEGRREVVHKMLARPDNNMVFIVGLSGIGKTTLARRVFNEVSDDFDVTYFVSLDSIDGVSNGKERLLQRIQDGVVGVNRISHDNLWSVIHQLKEVKVFMVLDNVESQDQLNALHTETWLEGSPSKLIVTTTNIRLRTRSQSNTFQVPYLTSSESKQLFCYYAFEGGDGPKDLNHLISEVVQGCENFPLSVKIVSGYVSSWEDVHHKHLWLNLLDRLKKCQEVDGGPDCRLWARLRLCYEALEPIDKEIFIDIATFFHGWQLSLVEHIWNGSRESPYMAWMNLRQRFLADMNPTGFIWMHRLLRRLGQSIACSPSKPLHKWERITDTATAKELIANHQGIVDTKALKLQVLENERLTLRNTTFLKYVRLQYLILEGVMTSRVGVELPRSLVYLRWKDGSFKSCPVDFTHLEKLVVLELLDCKSMKSFPPGIVAARRLTWLDLEGCLSLTELPSGLSECLEHLGLNRTGLRKLPSDLRKLKDLKQLQASHTQLIEVPPELGRLQMLSSLVLRGTGVTTLPESVCDLKGLSKLDLSSTMLGSLPETIGQLHNLSVLELHNTYLKSIPESVGALLNLKDLMIGNTPLETLPDSICEIRSLRQLDLTDTQICTLPGEIGKLVNLYNFQVRSPRLLELPETIGMLSGLWSFEGPLCPLRRNCAPSLESKDAGGEGEQSALSLRDGQSQMEMLPLISLFPRLKNIQLLTLRGKDCPEPSLQPLFSALRQIEGLDLLRLEDFNLVEIIPSELGKLPEELTGLDLVRWERLRELPESLVELRSLRSLYVEDLPRLCRLPEGLPLNLRLTVRKCGSLQNMQCPMSHRSSSDRESSEPLLHNQRSHRWHIESDSWRILECMLECNKTHSSDVSFLTCFFVECNKMEKALRRAMEKASWYEVESRVAVEELNELRLYFTRQRHGLRRASRLSSSHSSSRIRRQSLYIRCRDECSVHGNICVSVVDSNHEDSSDIVVDAHVEEEERQAFIFQFLRAFWSFLLCTR